MLTAEGVHRVAEAMERLKAIADADNRNDVVRMQVLQVAYITGWAEALHDFDTMPVTWRMRLHRTRHAVEAAKCLDCEITGGERLFKEGAVE